ncbi:MAG: efflux RND transporter periplasmic adaptor subunit [Hahellaceae bacterium]|nr:efflux RND transporter periplasmic adaptor subunit [Hahellaceae bacterium]
MNKASVSYWLAVGTVVGLILWFSTGTVTQAGTSLAEKNLSATAGPLKVAYRALQAETIAHALRAEGQVEADKAVTLAARLDSVVSQVRVKAGARVTQGTVLVEMDQEDWPSRLASAKAAVELAKAELAAARSLSDRGLASDTSRKERQANLAQAEAQQMTLETQLGFTTVRAPFSGVVETVEVEGGESVRNGSPLLRLIDDQHLKLVVRVPQQSIQSVALGQSVTGRLLDGRVLRGKVSFIGAEADAETRTYRVEAAFLNPGGTRLSGATASVSVDVGSVLAHRLSPAYLSLNPEGQLSVQIVDEQNTLRELPVERVRADKDSVWVTGLPPLARMVTLGKGFAPVGSVVEATEEQDLFAQGAR